jgi:hypothetical protein
MVSRDKLITEIEGGQTSLENKLFLSVQISFFLFLKKLRKKLYLIFSKDID